MMAPDATFYFTEGLADMASSQNPKIFFPSLKANLDPRFELSVADLPF